LKKRRHQKKLDTDLQLRTYVYEKLENEWSPEEIANRIKQDYPQDKAMRISHETPF
jgi:IS30 family transposase